jgi:hypothetical protein
VPEHARFGNRGITPPRLKQPDERRLVLLLERDDIEEAEALAE